MPFCRAMFDDERFQRLTPTEKIYYWFLVSEFNLYGEFVCADSKAAENLSVSLAKIRQARRKLTKMGLIRIQTGFIKGDRNFATKYCNVEWSRPSQRLKKQFVRMHRQAFEVLLDWIRQKVLTHAEVVVLICLYYWKHLLNGWKIKGENGPQSFFIAKSMLRKLSGIRDCSKLLANLYENIVLGEDSHHLFEYADNHISVNFDKWFFNFECQDDDEEEEKEKEKLRW